MSGGYSEVWRSNDKQQEVRTESQNKKCALRRGEDSSLLEYDAVPNGDGLLTLRRSSFLLSSGLN